MKYILPLLLVPWSLSAATYYVDTTNSAASDSNGGSISLPWKTIGKAKNVVAAGDTVIVQPGVYNESVAVVADGTAGNPITFTGVRGSGGEWLTIIDPSTSISNGWVAASEIGSGVWKKTNMTFLTAELTINTQRVCFVADMGGPYGTGYTNFSDGASAMACPSNTTTWLGMAGGNWNFWDGIEALWGSTNATTTYLRFRDGRNPNGELIRAANNTAAIRISRAYNTWKNFHIRGAFTGFYLQSNASHHNLILSNYVEGGFKKINLEAPNGETGPYANTIQNNEITENYYGATDFGAWDTSTNYSVLLHQQEYIFSKFLMGAGGVESEALYGLNLGSTNIFVGNHVFNTLGDAVMIENQTPHEPFIGWGNEFYSNNIANLCSFAFMLQEGLSETKVHDNLVSDVAISFRLHKLDYSDTNRVTYIYRNQCYVPAGLSEHFFTFASSTNDYWPVFWIYQNSCSGAKGILQDTGNANQLLYLRNTHFINNVLDAAPYLYGAGLDGAFLSSTNGLAQFDYNYIVSPPGSNAVWFGAHNVVATTNQWMNVSNMSFALPTGSQAIDAGVDIPTVYPTLPWTSVTKTGSAWDIGALEFATNGAPTITVQPVAWTNLVGVQFYLTVTATGDAPLSYQWRKDAANIGGATSSGYTNASPITAASGSYNCVVSNVVGVATSSSVYVSITNTPAPPSPPGSIGIMRISTLRPPP